MSVKKGGTGSLNDRMRAVTGGGPKPRPNPVLSTPAPASTKNVRNKRGAERKDAFKQGLLVSATGERLQVVLKNVSETGARVDFFSGGTFLFGRMELVVPSLGLQRWVRVVWKDRNSAGLEFEEE